MEQPICLDDDAAGSSLAAGVRDPLEAIGQSVLIPVLMRELNRATFTGMLETQSEGLLRCGTK